MNELRPPIKPGEWALDFALSRADQEGTVSVADYRGRSPLLLSFFRGLYCAFCRRAIWRRHLTNNKLRALDVETLGVVATTPENARRYFRYRPAHSVLAADPVLTTLRAYGLPKVELPWRAVQSTRVNPTDELPEPLPVGEAAQALTRLDRYRPTDTDQEEQKRTWNQSAGEFLIDRGGIVRWAFVEYASEI